MEKPEVVKHNIDNNIVCIRPPVTGRQNRTSNFLSNCYLFSLNLTVVFSPLTKSLANLRSLDP